MDRWFSLINGWFRPKLEAEDNALEQFERLWSDQESGRRITFMSIAFNTETSTDDITGIGVSHWSKQSVQHQAAYHWRIVQKVETKDVTIFGNPDLFDFGTTQSITSHDIRTVLDDWALSLAGSSEELCIVMYGQEQIKTLGRHWKSPVPVVVLDFEAAWNQRYHEAIHSTFEEVASTSKDIASTTSSLDHAGNQAYCLLVLLKSLENKNKNPPPELEGLFE